MHDIDPDMVPESVTPESLIDFDNEVITTAPMITDDDILLQQISKNSLMKMIEEVEERHQNDC